MSKTADSWVESSALAFPMMNRAAERERTPKLYHCLAPLPGYFGHHCWRIVKEEGERCHSHQIGPRRDWSPRTYRNWLRRLRNGGRADPEPADMRSDKREEALT